MKSDKFDLSSFDEWKPPDKPISLRVEEKIKRSKRARYKLEELKKTEDSNSRVYSGQIKKLEEDREKLLKFLDKRKVSWDRKEAYYKRQIEKLEKGFTLPKVYTEDDIRVILVTLKLQARIKNREHQNEQEIVQELSQAFLQQTIATLLTQKYSLILEMGLNTEAERKLLEEGLQKLIDRLQELSLIEIALDTNKKVPFDESYKKRAWDEEMKALFIESSEKDRYYLE